MTRKTESVRKLEAALNPVPTTAEASALMARILDHESELERLDQDKADWVATWKAERETVVKLRKEAVAELRDLRAGIQRLPLFATRERTVSEVAERLREEAAAEEAPPTRPSARAPSLDETAPTEAAPALSALPSPEDAPPAVVTVAPPKKRGRKPKGGAPAPLVENHAEAAERVAFELGLPERGPVELPRLEPAPEGSRVLVAAPTPEPPGLCAYCGGGGSNDAEPPEPCDNCGGTGYELDHGQEAEP